MNAKKTYITSVKEEGELSNGKFKALIENALEDIVLYDASGVIQYASRSFQDFWGCEEPELLGRKGTDLVHPEDRETARDAFYSLLTKPDSSITLIQRFITKNGNHLLLEYTMTNLLNNPDVKGIISNFRNVRDRKITEQKRLLHTISENIIDGIFLGIPQKAFHYVNKAFLEITGYRTPQEVTRLNPKKLYARTTQWQYVHDEITKHGFIKNERVLFKKKSGEEFWILLSISNFNDEDGKKFFVGSLRNITKDQNTEDELQKSQELLNAVNRNINEAVYRSSKNRLIYVNETFIKMFGYKGAKALLKMDPGKLYAERIGKKYLRILHEKGRVENVEIQYRKKSGKKFWGLLSCSLVRGKRNELFIDGAIRDITQQKEAQEELRKSQEFISSINRNISEGIFRGDGKRIHYVNEAFVKIFGYSSIAELLAVSPTLLYANVKDRKRILAKLKNAKELTNQEVLYRKKNGETFWGLVSYTVLKSDSGKIFIDGAIRDVTHQKESDEQLRLSQRLLSSINRNISEGIYRNIPGKGFVYANPAFLKLFGFKSLDEINTIKPVDLYASKKDRHEVRKTLLEKGEIRNAEILFRKKNGEQFWGALSTSEAIEEGKLFYDGAIRDIAKQKKSENELIESRNFMDNVMRTVAAPIFVKDSKHRWIMFNDAFCWFMGKPRKELLHKSDYDFVSRDEAEVFWKIDEQVLRTGEVVLNRERITIKKGHVRHLFTVKSRYVNEQGEKFVIGFITDITDIKEVEERINQLNANLQGVMESTNDQIIAVDNEYRYLMFNQSHAREIRLSTKKTIKRGSSVLEAVPRDRKKIAKDEIDRALNGESFISEYNLAGGIVLEASYNAIRNERDVILGVAIFIRDITARIRAEKKLKALNDELTMQNWQLASQEEELKATLEELSERNFELDQLMYKTSHDLRSPLSSILGLVNLARLDTDKTNNEEYLDKIEGRINKLDEFISSMLNYAQVNRSETSYEAIDLQEIALNSIRELEHLENFKDIDVEIVSKGKVKFKSDLLRVRMIFSNIISNAFKYYNAEVDSYLKISIEINPMSATIVFKDNGIGIQENYLARVFDMFFRATERSQGSGLGMYIVKQAVDKLKGTISIKSKYTKGTTIKIVLPND